MSGVNSSNFMYGGQSSPTQSGADTGQRFTPGGYPVGAGKESRTGLYRTKVPFLPAPVPASEMRQGINAARYTYRNYAVPEFQNSEFVGMPAGSHLLINGENATNKYRQYGNTTAELQRIESWDSKSLKEIQTVAVKLGWLPKEAITGRPTSKTMSLVAFLMDQGNRLGQGWQDVMSLGPDGLRKVGGTDVVTGFDDGGSGSKGYDGPVTSVSKSVNYSTKAAARNLLKETLSSVLGRGPRDDEVDEFLDLLRAKQKANPEVTTTVRDGSDDGSSSISETTTESGFGPDAAQALAERYSTNINPEQAERYKRAGYEQLLDSLIAGG